MKIAGFRKNLKRKYTINTIKKIFVILIALLLITFLFTQAYFLLRKSQLSHLNSLLKDLDLQTFDENVLNGTTPKDFVKKLLSIPKVESEILNISRYEDDKKKIIEEFDKSLNEYISKVKEFKEVDTTFLPESIDQIEFNDKKNSKQYFSNLKSKFKTNIDKYNKKANAPLRYEVSMEEYLTKTNINNKITQLFIFGITGTNLSRDEQIFLEKYKPAGVVFLGDNVTQELNKFTNNIQKTNLGIPVFTAIDQEGGIVKRISWDDTPDPKAISTLADKDACEFYKKRSLTLFDEGINLNLGIVADVTSDPSSFIFQRTFNGNYEQVAKIVANAVKCTDKNLMVAKHYPGHGATIFDTHLAIAEIYKAKDKWLKEDFVPFKSSADSNIAAIMTGHLKLNWLDKSKPTTLSKKGIDYLRTEAKFNGLVITDDMIMLRSSGINDEAGMGEAIKAGNDILLYSINDPSREILLKKAIEIVKKGLISEKELNGRVGRIIEAKNKIVRMQERYVSMELVY